MREPHLGATQGVANYYSSVRTKEIVKWLQALLVVTQSFL